MRPALLLIGLTLTECATWPAAAVAEEVERTVEYERLTTFQMVARADIVVHARVKDGAGRFAIVQVLSALKGDPPGEELRIDFRELNLSPHGQEFVVFRSEEDYILYLMRKHWRRPNEKNANILDLLHGRRGRTLLPAEGWADSVDAIRRLVPLALSGPEEQIDGLRALLSTDNPFLKEVILEELNRLRSAVPADLPVLVRLLLDASPRIRSLALSLIAPQFAATSSDELQDSDRQSALGMVLERARGDADAGVRAESVRTLGAWPTPKDIVADLKAIARQDPSQSVRYEAERILFRMRP